MENKINAILMDPVHIKIQKHLDTFNLNLKVIEFKESTKTSELAAQALGVEVGQIAKTLLFLADDKPVLVVTSGDVKTDTKKLKKLLGVRKVKFAPTESALEITGYAAGGVCPLELPKEMDIYLDESMKRFDKVYMAAGTAHSAIPVTFDELQIVTKGVPAELSL